MQDYIHELSTLSAVAIRSAIVMPRLPRDHGKQDYLSNLLQDPLLPAGQGPQHQMASNRARHDGYKSAPSHRG